jgi:uncharacterized protein
MTERNGYQPGVPCWVDTWQPDADAAARFYAELFGWEPEGSAGGPYIASCAGATLPSSASFRPSTRTGPRPG